MRDPSTTGPEILGKFAAFFGCDIELDVDIDEISFNADVIRLPLVAADSFLNELMTKMCDDTLATR